MRLLDSNIVIYAAQPANTWLRMDILSQPFAVSQATRVEVLGWHRITPADLQDLEAFLVAGTLFSITDAIADRAVTLRQQKKMSWAMPSSLPQLLNSTASWSRET